MNIKKYIIIALIIFYPMIMTAGTKKETKYGHFKYKEACKLLKKVSEVFSKIPLLCEFQLFLLANCSEERGARSAEPRVPEGANTVHVSWFEANCVWPTVANELTMILRGANEYHIFGHEYF